MIENKDFQELLKRYPKDAIIFMGVKYNGVTAFWDVKVEGIKFQVNDKDFKAIIIINEELSKEYEHLINGGDVDDEVYRQ